MLHSYDEEQHHQDTDSEDDVDIIAARALEEELCTPLRNLPGVTGPLDRVIGLLAVDPTASKLPSYGSVEEALGHALSGSLSFDSFQLHKLTSGRPLSTLALHIFKEESLIEHLKLNEKKLYNFLLSVEDLMGDHPYHNRVHITDVLQALYAHTLPTGGLASLCQNQPLHLLAVLLAAIVHDLDHPGVNNDFLIKSGHPFAERYMESDRSSINELHHLDMTLQLLRREENNFLQSLSFEEWGVVWAIVREMVLNTDMKRHMPFIEDVKQASSDLDGDEELTEMSLVRIAMQCSIAMKCADLGHCVRPSRLHVQWTKAVTTEFYRQGEYEMEQNLPVTQGMYRPEDETEVFRSQAMFLDDHVRPLFEEWVSFSPSSHGEEMLSGLMWNIRQWQELAGKPRGEPKGETVTSLLLRQIRNRGSRRAQSSSGVKRRPSNLSKEDNGSLREPEGEEGDDLDSLASSLCSIPSNEYLEGLETSSSSASALVMAVTNCQAIGALRARSVTFSGKPSHRLKCCARRHTAQEELAALRAVASRGAEDETVHISEISA